MSSTIALFREQQVFCSLESTAGTQVAPATTDLVLTKGPGEMNQEIELLEDMQFRNSRSKLGLIQGRIMPGKWSMDTYLKPSGTKGIGPEQDNLFKCLMGTKTPTWTKAITLAGTTSAKDDVWVITVTITGPVTKYTDTYTVTGDPTEPIATVATALADAVPSAGWTVSANAAVITVVSTVSDFTITCTKNDVANGTQVNTSKVEYTFADNLPSMTITRLLGHTAFIARGATVDKGEFTVESGKPGELKASGEFMEMAYIGTSTLNGGINNAVTTITVADGTRFYVTSNTTGYAKIGDEAVEVTAVSGNELTVTRAACSTSAAEHLTGVAIEPYVPTGVEVGIPVHGKMGAVTVGGTSVLLISSKISVDNAIKYYIDEKNGVLTAENYGTPGLRTVTLTASRYFRAGDTGAWKSALNRSTAALSLAIGETAGSIITFTAPYAQYKSPKISGSAEATQDLEVRLVATSAAPGTELKITCT